MSGFQDHFSDRADGYAKYRPGYPDSLFEWLAGLVPSRGCAWDCATGSGQAVPGLAHRFSLVIATDASPDQLRHAPRLPNVDYRIARAEECGLEDGSVDLVTVAQALHWLDHPRFFAEVGRVTKPGGVLAAWMYNMLETDPPIDQALRRFYSGTVGPYWPGDRRYVDTEYRTIPIPFPAIAAPAFAMEAEWSLAHLIGYLRTWSAVARCRQATGVDPVVDFSGELAALWGSTGRVRLVRWPLSLRVARVRPPETGFGSRA
ncbi:MAG: class I SAM-dependent methyltransferase [Gemmatimonadetes bacterium]|nr:class I SAM-dependent methyltransferase [Gemmatimonadota bacterium]